MASRDHGDPGDAPSVPPPLNPVANAVRPSAAEEARTIAASTNIATLASLTADGDQTIFVWEERGMPVRLLAPYGAGIQAQVEDLGAYIAGRKSADFGTRWSELHPPYEELAAGVR